MKKLIKNMIKVSFEFHKSWRVCLGAAVENNFLFFRKGNGFVTQKLSWTNF